MVLATRVDHLLKADHTHDLLGRQTKQIDYTNGVTKAYDLSRTYNAKSQVTSETATTLRDYKTYKTYTSYNYGYGSDYALGAAVSVFTRNYKANSSYSTESTATTTNSYDWYNGAVQKDTTYKLSTSSYTNRTYYTVDSSGRLESAWIYTGRGPRWFSLSWPRRIIINQRTEALALKRLQGLQKLTPGAHFVSRHGVQTSLVAQRNRALSGVNPSTGLIERRPQGASRFLSHKDQFNAIERASTILRQTGSLNLASSPLRFRSTIGEGYLRSGQYRSTHVAQTFFDSTTNLPVKSFPSIVNYGK